MATLHLLKPQADILMDFETPILAAVAGSGGGKTCLGYWWLATRMEREPGYGWAMAEPTYPMLAKIIINSPDPNRPNLVAFLDQIDHQPRFNRTDKIIETRYGMIYLGSADNPDGMQGAAVKGYWLDEAGMMRLLAYETAEQRVGLFEGQVLLTTTPYNRGWLKTEVHDKADGKYIHYETWRSLENPAYPDRRYHLLKAKMSKHRAAMMLDAQFARPEGMIYGDFNEDKCVVPRFDIPEDWFIYVGMDFGGVNTAAIFYAEDPETARLYAFAEYLAGGLTCAGHALRLQEIVGDRQLMRVVGGAASEDQWRQEFAAAGWDVECPVISSVEVGIDRVVAKHKEDLIYVFDDLAHYLDEKRSYSRKMDESGLPTEGIEDKARFHHMDCERYIVSQLSSRAAFAADMA